MVDWSDQINRFEPLAKDDVSLFAPPTEMEQAVAIYNRAIANLHQDSQDIALISLRKLASVYPLFPQPAFLLGCLLARSGRKAEAADLIEQALAADLPEELQADAQLCLSYVNVRQPEHSKSSADSGNSTPLRRTASLPAGVGAAAILERTRRHGKVRMASERERRSVIRSSEFPEEKETRVYLKKDLVEWLRIGLPILAGVLVLVVLVLAGIRWLPSLNLSLRTTNGDEEKLSWLLQRLDQMAAEDEAIAHLMSAYEAQFAKKLPEQQTDPSGIKPTEPVQTTATTTTATAATPSPTQPSPTPSPTPVPTPTPDPAIAALLEAAAALENGRTLLSDDLARGSMALLEARALLSDIPDQTTAEGVTGNAADLSREVEDLIGEIAVSAANALRRIAQPLFNDAAYEEARVYYQAAYDLYPRAYGGGVAYYLGRCFQLLEEPETARIYFEFVIEQFSGRDIASSAAYRLREMGY